MSVVALTLPSGDLTLIRLEVPHRMVERRDAPPASYPQPSSPYADPQREILCGHLVEGHRNGAYCHPPRYDDDGGYARHVVTWLYKSSENGGTGVALPRAGRARSHDRLGVLAGGGPCHSRSQGT
jgi:hypothetical protein